MYNIIIIINSNKFSSSNNQILFAEPNPNIKSIRLLFWYNRHLQSLKLPSLAHTYLCDYTVRLLFITSSSTFSIWLLLDVQRAIFGYYLTFSEQYLVITWRSASSIWLLLDVQRAVFGYYLTFSEQYLVITWRSTHFYIVLYITSIELVLVPNIAEILLAER
jgi:hypothetical protein